MPTFQSIGMHPELCHRLVTESRATSTTASSAAEQDALAPQRQLVRTPQALLARNPNTVRLLDGSGTSTIRDGSCGGSSSHVADNNGDLNSDAVVPSRPISLAQVQKLRADVSNALIAQSNNGKRIQRIHKTLDTTTNAGEATMNIRGEHSIPGTLSALDWLRYETIAWPQDPPVLSTGCCALDQAIAMPTEYQNVSTSMMLETATAAIGIPFGYVTQFSGPTGSGKTQLALHLAAHSPPSLYRTWYLGSNCGTLVALRLAELCQNNYSVLERTIFCSTTNEFELLQHLAQLEAELIQVTTTQQHPQKQHPFLLILDSCSACLSSSEPEWMSRVSLTLRRLTRQYSKILAVVLLNGTVSKRGEPPGSSSTSSSSSHRTVKPALGRLWTKTADIHVWLEHCQQQQQEPKQQQQQPSIPSNGGSNSDGPTTIRATVERHVAKRTSNCANWECCFRLTAMGIQDVPRCR